jgi:pimeloyl-ACP methyl ester carboxylesterase
MGYRVLGSGDKHLILIHGLTGSSRQFLVLDEFLRKNGITAIAPNLYGNKTDWAMRSGVMDSGNDIAELSRHIFGKGSAPVILCVSAGAKDGLATVAALNSSAQANQKVPSLYVVSGQFDLGRCDTFGLLSREKQFEINAILGVSKEARFPAFQGIRDIGGNLRQRIAHRLIDGMTHNPRAAYDKIVGSMSHSEDWPVLRQDPAFNNAMFKDISEYSTDEIFNSVHRLFNWDIDFTKIKGTRVNIIQGTADCTVAPNNAPIMESVLQQAGVETTMTWYPDGHLLLKKRSEDIGKRILKDVNPPKLENH